MSVKNPVLLVKEKFGDKAKLVEAVEKLSAESLWVSRTNKDKGLAHVSNAKLLRLHATFTEVKEKFGTREKLIDAVLALTNSTKDTGLRQKLSTWPVPRLYDAFKSGTKRTAAAKKPKPAKKAAAKPAAAKKAEAKPAAKKTAAKKK
jgi:hypothetical protein